MEQALLKLFAVIALSNSRFQIIQKMACFECVIFFTKSLSKIQVKKDLNEFKSKENFKAEKF